MITLTAITLDRYLVITRPLATIGVASKRQAALVLLGVWLYALAWSLPPFFGWSKWLMAWRGSSRPGQAIWWEPSQMDIDRASLGAGEAGCSIRGRSHLGGLCVTRYRVLRWAEVTGAWHDQRMGPGLGQPRICEPHANPCMKAALDQEPWTGPA